MLYLETLASRQPAPLKALVKQVTYDANFEVVRRQLLDDGMSAIVTGASAETDGDVALRRSPTTRRRSARSGSPRTGTRGAAAEGCRTADGFSPIGARQVGWIETDRQCSV